jgi:hypothetical protein
LVVGLLVLVLFVYRLPTEADCYAARGAVDYSGRVCVYSVGPGPAFRSVWLREGVSGLAGWVVAAASVIIGLLWLAGTGIRKVWGHLQR